MSWLFCVILAAITVNVLTSPIPKENESIEDPPLQPDTARKFADVFHYSLENCGAYGSHEATELKDSILELSDALGKFPQIHDADRILLHATAATIANSVMDKKDGDAIARATCVMDALKTASRMTSGAFEEHLVYEVEKLIEVFALENDAPIFTPFSSSAESSLGNYYYESYDSSDYYEEDYYDSYDYSDYYEEDYYESYDDFYDEDYYGSYDSSEYSEYYDDLLEYLEEDSSSSEYYEDYEDYYSHGYNEEYYPVEHHREGFYEETPVLIEPHFEDDLLREEKIRNNFRIEEPEVFEIVPVGYEIVPVEITANL